IKYLKLLARVLILFVKKKNSTLKLYIDYKSLNKIIIKNYYLLSFITKFIQSLTSIKPIIEFRLKKKISRKQPFKYNIVILTLVGLVNITCIIYLNNILVFSNLEKAYISYVK
ncbi:hypothetical protein K505DRAFT_190453, partial [Melanomma pulvis-pyrius CBS 109.77]